MQSRLTGLKEILGVGTSLPAFECYLEACLKGFFAPRLSDMRRINRLQLTSCVGLSSGTTERYIRLVVHLSCAEQTARWRRAGSKRDEKIVAERGGNSFVRRHLCRRHAIGYVSKLRLTLFQNGGFSRQRNFRAPSS